MKEIVLPDITNNCVFFNEILWETDTIRGDGVDRVMGTVIDNILRIFNLDGNAGLPEGRFI
jgi:hypothetical protein